MDKKSTLGLVLITLVVMGWLYLTSTNTPPQNNTVKKTDSIAKTSGAPATTTPTNVNAAPTASSDTNWAVNKFGTNFAKFATGIEERYTVETDLYTARISNKGGVVLAWKLNKFNKWDKTPVQLIDNNKGELFLSFVGIDGKKIDTRNLFFNVNNKGAYEFKVKGKDSLKLDFTLDLGAGKSIVKSVTFYGNVYHIDQNVAINNLDGIMTNRGYNLVWENGLRYQEENSVDESSDAVSMVSMKETVEEVNADKDEPIEKSFTGVVDFAATKNKYFVVGIIPQPWNSFDGTVDLAGHKNHYPDNGVVEKYGLNFRVPYKGGVQTTGFRTYLGPNDYDIVKTYKMGATVNFGWKFLVRPIGEYFMLPIFRFLHQYVPNYGIAILLFAFIIKILLHPLSIQQMRSTQKMQLLNPELTALREKYKDDQAKQQQETMKLYSQYGINPAGGCLPLLLQMPILFALWAVLRSAIELRQAPFMLWIHDLSIPDSVFNFGFSFMGVSHLSGLALFMGATMFIQQKMTVTDPKQKAMVYMMPLMFMFMFANFPAGLNLYYSFFNVLAILQQVYMNKFSKKKLTLEDLKKAPKKEGWLAKKMREAQEIAASQGKGVPGSGNNYNKNNNPGQKRIPPKKGK